MSPRNLCMCSSFVNKMLKIVTNQRQFFSLWRHSPVRAQSVSFWGFQTKNNQKHTHAHTRQDSSERVISRLQRQLHTQQKANDKNIHALSGTRILGPSNQAVSDLHLTNQVGQRHLINPLKICYIQTFGKNNFSENILYSDTWKKTNSLKIYYI